MAVRQRNLQKIETFVWTQDPDYRPDGNHAEGVTKFQWRVLDAYESAYLKDRLTTVEKLPTGINLETLDLTDPKQVTALMSQTKTRTEVNKIALEAVRISCVGFENYLDKEGNPVVFEQEYDNIGGANHRVLAAHIAKALDIDMCMEWYMAIEQANRLSAREAKNSPPA